VIKVKFITAIHNSEEFSGVILENENKILPLNLTNDSFLPKTMVECIALGEAFIEEVNRIISNSKETDFLSLEDVTLIAPIPRPSKNIFCVGKNYAEHAIELGSADDIPEHIMVFTKAPTAVTGPNTTILNHLEVTNQLDYEGELAVIIGKKGKAIKREEALEYIFGYTIINDITARDLQSRHQQFFIGKSLDTSCPMGPWIVHKSIIENPNRLNIETKVNGDVRQSSNTEKFIFPIEEVIAVLSAGMTLEPGDIIATGTPAGVGKGFKPPKFLHPGDQIDITIEKIGTLTNIIERS
jgi:2-keto-4-pentenoate hydratase/2-oxohepta-3-ene-1,7-dioic acid hydratase in catechol pathway